jgi:hypothetical protein
MWYREGGLHPRAQGALTKAADAEPRIWGYEVDLDAVCFFLEAPWSYYGDPVDGPLSSFVASNMKGFREAMKQVHTPEEVPQ